MNTGIKQVAVGNIAFALMAVVISAGAQANRDPRARLADSGHARIQVATAN
jgi:hypothetical protein